MPDAAAGSERPPWRRWTITLPALLAVAETLLLSSVGALGVSSSLAAACARASGCTGSCPHCTAMHLWLDVGVIGQWLLALSAGALLVLGVTRPPRRRMAAVAAWTLIPVAAIWFAASATLAGGSIPR